MGGPRPTGAKRRARRLAGTVAAAILAVAPAIRAAPAAAPDPAARPFEGPPPGDPYETVPPMPAPHAQPRATARRRLAGEFAVAAATRRRVSLAVLPLYAAAVLQLAGRERFYHHGAGVGLEVDLPLLRDLWFRVFGQFSAHPLREELDRKDDEVTVTAPAGTLTVAGTTAGLAYALDVSRMTAILDAGLGLSWIGTPKGVRDGQRGMPCSPGGGCDPGLACTAAGVCAPRPAAMAATR